VGIPVVVCTRVMWTPPGRSVLVGRNMDWLRDLGTNLWALPGGVRRTGISADPNPLTWDAEYGSVVATAYDAAATDGAWTCPVPACAGM
jgi:penicillin V acylase-like amidase (Ntn superfamily)